MFSLNMVLKTKVGNRKWLCSTTHLLGLVHWFNKYSIYAWMRPEHNILKRLIAFVGQHTVKDSNLGGKSPKLDYASLCET